MWFKKKSQEQQEVTEFLVGLRDNPERASEVLESAHQALMAGDLLMAEVLCAAVNEIHPSNPYAFVLRARIHLERGDYGKAQKAFAQAVALAHSDTQVLNACARLAADYDDSYTALQCYEKAADLEPDSSYWPYCVGCIRNRMEDWEEAEGQLSIAIEREGTIPGYYIQRGLTYLSTDRPELAMPDYLKAEELDPSSPSIQAVIAKVAFLLNDFDFALEKYDQAIEKGEETWENYHNRALTKSRLGVPGEAIEDFSKAIEVQPFPETYYQRSRMYSEVRDLESAIRDIDTVIEFDPTASHPYQVRAALYRDLGQDARAQEDDAKALQLSEG